MRTVTDRQRQTEAEALYELYGKPLEAEHRGQYVAITKGGKTFIGLTDLEVMQAAVTAFGPGSYIFKIGDRSIGRWR